MTLIAHYPLNEDTGTTAYDHTGNGNDGTVTGATLGATGLLGSTAYSFDGTDDYVGGIPRVDTPEGSVVLWLKPTNGAGTAKDVYVGTTDGSGTEFDLRNFNDGNSYWGWRINGTNYRIITSNTFPSGWFQATLTWNTTTGDSVLYWNGTKEGTTTGIPSMTHSRPPDIGRMNAPTPTEYAAVDIDSCRIYDHALTPTEVQYLYDVTSSATIYTGTQTHGSAVSPATLSTTVTLNGETVQVFVIGSPGTTSEEQPSESPITLDGTGSHALTWANTHTDFRLEVISDNPDVTKRAELDRLELQA